MNFDHGVLNCLTEYLAIECDPRQAELNLQHGELNIRSLAYHSPSYTFTTSAVNIGSALTPVANPLYALKAFNAEHCKS